MTEPVDQRVSLGQEPEELTSLSPSQLPEQDLAEEDLHPGKVGLGELRELIGGAGVELPPVDLR